MTERERRRTVAGVSLVEVLVVIGIVGILAAILAGAMVPMRQSARTIACMNNLRQISTALTTYYMDNRSFAASVDGSLPGLLSPYLGDAKVFRCPVEGDDTNDSYSDCWSPQLPNGPDAFMAACANHATSFTTMTSRSSIMTSLDVPAAFAGGRTQSARTTRITWNGNPIDPGTTVTGGTLRFVDGTTVTISAGMQVLAVASFEEAQSRICSAVRVDDGSTGTLTVQAASGTHFDLATPACTIGVRGTQYTATISETASAYGTRVAVASGTVAVSGGYPASGESFLQTGQTRDFARVKNEVVAMGILSVTGPTFSGKKVTYSLTNIGSAAYVLDTATVTWPVSNNKKLQTVTLGGTTVWSTTMTTSPVALKLTGAGSVRTIAAGATKQLVVNYSTTANTTKSKYALALSE